MKKKIFGTMVAVAAMFAGYSAYDAQNERGLTDVALANVEALAQSGESGNERPKYINETEIKTRTETKVEANKNGITVSYTKTCSDVITYCEHTGKKDDICYVDLNGIKTTCGEWIQD